jgi:hypothetical protein
VVKKKEKKRNLGRARQEKKKLGGILRVIYRRKGARLNII